MPLRGGVRRYNGPRFSWESRSRCAYKITSHQTLGSQNSPIFWQFNPKANHLHISKAIRPAYHNMANNGASAHTLSRSPRGSYTSTWHLIWGYGITYDVQGTHSPSRSRPALLSLKSNSDQNSPGHSYQKHTICKQWPRYLHFKASSLA